MAGDDVRPRCGEPTAAGHPCRNYAVQDGRCRVHLRLAAEEESERSSRSDPAEVDETATGPAADPPEPDEPVGAGTAGGPGRGGRPFDGQAPPPGTSVLDALAAVLGDDLSAHLEAVADFVRRRFTGDYAVDEYGLDPHLTEHVMMPLVMPLYRHWWRVSSHGRDNLPAGPTAPDGESGGGGAGGVGSGGALIVANHAGTLPADGVMLHVDLWEATGRHPRELGADLVFETPFVGHFARKSGATRAGTADADDLLRRGELVVVFPEGFKGLGKPFTSRYRLERFGRGGFVATALRTGAPIVPTAIVGSEEIWPIVWDSHQVARALGLPYFPVVAQSLAMPLLGPLALLPLPSKWSITYGDPIPTDHLGPEAADDPMVVFDLADQVRSTIQDMLTRILMGRQSVFF